MRQLLRSRLKAGSIHRKVPIRTASGDQAVLPDFTQTRSVSHTRAPTRSPTCPHRPQQRCSYNASEDAMVQLPHSGSAAAAHAAGHNSAQNSKVHKAVLPKGTAHKAGTAAREELLRSDRTIGNVDLEGGGTGGRTGDGGVCLYIQRQLVSLANDLKATKCQLDTDAARELAALLCESPQLQAVDVPLVSAVECASGKSGLSSSALALADDGVSGLQSVSSLVGSEADDQCCSCEDSSDGQWKIVSLLLVRSVLWCGVVF